MKSANNETTEVLDEGMLTEYFSQGGTFKELKNLSNSTMESVYSVAYNLYQSGKYVEAIKVFQFLCFYDHYSVKYYLGLGACRFMQKEYENAIEFLGFAASMNTDDPRAILYIGDCHLAMGNDESAKIAYKTAVEWAGDQEEFTGEKKRAENMLSSLETSEKVKKESSNGKS